MKKRIQIFTTIVFFVLLFLIFIYAVFLGPFFVISKIQLTVGESLKADNSYPAKQKDIQLYLNKYKGQKLWALDLKTMVKDLARLQPGIELYSRRVFPNQLHVFLDKKHSPLLLLKGEGLFYSVTQEGEISTLKNSFESLDYPLLRGQFFLDQLSLRKQALNILSALPEEGLGFSVKNISEIFYNPKSQSLLFYLISPPFVLELKQPPDLKKIQNIDFVLNYLKLEGRESAFIDARKDKKIIVKKLK